MSRVYVLYNKSLGIIVSVADQPWNPVPQGCECLLKEGSPASLLAAAPSYFQTEGGTLIESPYPGAEPVETPTVTLRRVHALEEADVVIDKSSIYLMKTVPFTMLSVIEPEDKLVGTIRLDNSFTIKTEIDPSLLTFVSLDGRVETYYIHNDA